MENHRTLEEELSRLKEQASQAVQAGDLTTALKVYSRGLSLEGLPALEMVEIHEARAKCFRELNDQAAEIEELRKANRLLHENGDKLLETIHQRTSELEQRNAELAIINAIQRALALELDIRGIYNEVGDKLGEIFDFQTIAIYSANLKKGLVTHEYFCEKGQKYEPTEIPFNSLYEYLLSLKSPFVRNGDFPKFAIQFEDYRVPRGEMPRALVVVPVLMKQEQDLVVALSLMDIDGEKTFSESDIHLLETLGNSMSIAIDNARLFDETQRLLKETDERNAELAVINSIQAGLASKLEMHAIYDLVGDEISEITGSEIVVINTWNDETGMVRYEYIREKGERFDIIERPLSELNKFILPELEEGKSIIWNEGMPARLKEFGHSLPAGEMPLSVISVPVKTGSKINTSISLQDTSREHAFSDSTIRLIETLAGSMGIALENARLFDETQRLLKETEERNAELAVINSVQQGLAAELDFQGIVDLVGDRLVEVLHIGNVSIIWVDYDQMLAVPLYVYIDGQRVEQEPWAPGEAGKAFLENRQPIIWNSAAQAEELGLWTREGDREALSGIFMPIIGSDKLIGAIRLEHYEQEGAFDESDVRLVNTVAASMGIALENARLFNEIQTRNVQITDALERQTATSDILRVIASSPTDATPVMDVIAEYCCRLCNVPVAVIYQLEGESFTYLSSFGASSDTVDLLRENPPPFNRGSIAGRVAIERRAMQIEDIQVDPEYTYGSQSGIQPIINYRTLLGVPVMRETEVLGYLALARQEVEPFNQREIELVSTFASQAAIALENVRLFNETTRLLKETTQQAAELATINQVSSALAAEQNLDALVQIAGDQLRRIFDADIAYVALLDPETKKINFPYQYGEEFAPIQFGEGLTSKIIETGEPLLINQDIEQRRISLGVQRIGKEAQSYLGVPIFGGRQAIGAISVQSTQAEDCYTQDDVRLLSTIAANVGLAINNANLFDEINYQRKYYEMIIANSPAAIVLTDDRLNVTVWNPAAERLFGYSREDATGRNIDSLVANREDIHDEAVAASNQMSTDSETSLIAKRTRKDGSLVDVEISALRVIVDDRQTGWLAIYHDITELQRARQEAIQANQAKSAFLANMSHELRTPLNAIIGFTRIIRRKGKDALPQKQLDNLDKVLSSSDHLLGLINTVLDIAKIEAGHMDVQVSSFQIKPLIELTANTSQPLIRNRQVKLRMDVQEDIPPLHTDQEKVKQILLNLLSNAAKFTHEGSITVKAWTKDDRLKLSVTDTGIGISPQALKRVFEEFQQADASTTRQYGGTGLGLSISRSLAQLLGGNLAAESEEGLGSIFTLDIPLIYDPGRSPQTDIDRRDVHEEYKYSGDAPVLVIDDHPDAIELLREMLEEAGYKVVAAQDGMQGLRLARELLPMAITLDVMMPNKDGWQVLHDLKTDPLTKGIPVILVTVVDKKALGYRLGAADYLVKPLNADKVLESLARAAGKQQAPRLLVVDDDPDVIDMIKQLLAESPYRIETAADGEQALEAVRSAPPDIILLDLLMPNLDGFGVIEELRIQPETSRIPVIILTAKTVTQADMEILRDRIYAIVRKQGLQGDALLVQIGAALAEGNIE